MSKLEQKEKTADFTSVVNSGQKPPSQCLSEFLTNDEFLMLRQTNTETKKASEQVNKWARKLRQLVGSDLQFLVEKNETFQLSYHRHMGVINTLPPITQKIEIAERLTLYPFYYFSKIINPTDFAKLITNMDDLENFQENFPPYANRVAEHILSNSNDFRRIILNVTSLTKFQKLFPEHSKFAANRILSNLTDFKRIIASKITFDNFKRNFPQLAQATATVEWFCNQTTDQNSGTSCIPSVDGLIELYSISPKLADTIIQYILAIEIPLHLELIDNVNKFANFQKTFPQHVNAVAEIIINKPICFNDVVNNLNALVSFKESCPKFANAAAKRFLDNLENFKEVIENITNLKWFKKLFPELADIAVQRMMCDSGYYKQLFNNVNYLIRFKEEFPLFAHQATKYFLNDPDRLLWAATHIDNLTSLAIISAKQATTFAEHILSSPSDFARMIHDEASLERFKLTFPKLADAAVLIRKFLSNPSQCQWVFKNIDNLIYFQSISSKLAAIAAKKVLKNPSYFRKVIESIESLQRFHEAFPKYTAVAAKHILDDPTIFKRLIYDLNSLLYFQKLFPIYANEAAERIVDNPADFDSRVIVNFSSFLDFQKKFPQHANALVERILSNSVDFERVIDNINSLERLQKTFSPEHVTAVVDSILNTPCYFTKLICNTDHLQNFIELFPASEARANTMFSEIYGQTAGSFEIHTFFKSTPLDVKEKKGFKSRIKETELTPSLNCLIL